MQVFKFNAILQNSPAYFFQAYILKNGEPEQISGQQEHFEAMLNYYVWLN